MKGDPMGIGMQTLNFTNLTLSQDPWSKNGVQKCKKKVIEHNEKREKK
jgi:hypothetical protein